ncbi:MAG: HAD family hydrolase [Geminicoccaceae bacterium]|nr:MAG: HAD family hydrolase [Geminicoccaceae bacterium]
MWSGPRNLSTAMMRSFENRADCVVWDEPFYAPYLLLTGIDHPLRAATLAAWENDAAVVAERCIGPIPEGAAVFYQKHMTHHMVDGVPLDWMDHVTNAFLIRRPEAVVASYEAKRAELTLADLGFWEQRRLFERVADRLGAAPPVVDADDVRRAPEATLRALCAALGIAFDAAMLAWPSGPRASDGPWAAHWYDSVQRSTGFTPPDPPKQLSAERQRLADDALPHYEALAAFALKGRE